MYFREKGDIQVFLKISNTGNVDIDLSVIFVFQFMKDSHCRPQGKVLFSVHRGDLHPFRMETSLPSGWRPSSPLWIDPPREGTWNRQEVTSCTPSGKNMGPDGKRHHTPLWSLTSSGGHCSSRYASYWNAFLFVYI